MRNKRKTPAEQLSEFLNFVEQSYTDYQIASEALKEEDRRLQDLLHEMEFAADKAERNRVATKLQKSRSRENRDQKNRSQTATGQRIQTRKALQNRTGKIRKTLQTGLTTNLETMRRMIF